MLFGNSGWWSSMEEPEPVAAASMVHAGGLPIETSAVAEGGSSVVDGLGLERPR